MKMEHWLNRLMQESASIGNCIAVAMKEAQNDGNLERLRMLKVKLDQEILVAKRLLQLHSIWMRSAVGKLK